MSHCSLEQIQEKKRQALERLQAKKNVSPLRNSTNEYSSVPSTTNGQIPRFSLQNNVANSSKLINNINNTSNAYFSNNRASNRPNSYQPYSKQKTVSQPVVKPGEFYGFKEPVMCKCALISENMFSVECSKYFEPLINKFKTISSKNFDAVTKLWSFNVKDYDTVLTTIQLLRPEVIVEAIPKHIITKMMEKSPSVPGLEHFQDLSRIDSELLYTLMPFQIEGIRFGISKRGRCLIADEMGLGKTFQALAIASYYKEDWPLLIVTTSSMRNSWQDTIQKYLTSVPLHYVQHMKTGKDYIGESKILIVSHDQMTRSVDALLKCNFGVLIIDESHTMKNFKAKCTSAAMSLARQATRVVLLSGTPALSRPSELYTQISLIDEKFFKNFKEYSTRYCNGHETRFGWDATGQSNLKELEIILNKHFMIRRTKDEVLPELPSKTREIVNLNKHLLKLTEEEQRCLNLLESDYTRQKSGHDRNAAMLTFFNETAKLKVKAVCTYISELLKDERKCLIFVHHQVMLDNICQLLDRKHFKYIRIDGKTTSDQRSFFVDRFNTDDNYRCAVLSITAANAGITLTAASLVLFAELHWNPSILSQAESRAHRIGQENTVEVRYLLAEGTADDYIWKMIESKMDVLNEVGLSKDSFKNTTSSDQATDNIMGTQISGVSSQTSIKNYFQINKSSKIGDNSREEKSVDGIKENNSVGKEELNEIGFNISADDFNDDMSVLLNAEDDEALANLLL